MGCLKLPYDQEEGTIKSSPLKICKGLEKKEQSVIFCKDYTPFGLQFNQSRRTASVKNFMNTFQNQERDDATGWVKFKWRNHDPAIGRFFNVDPIAEDYYYNSPYAFSENKVINAVELEGLEKMEVIDGRMVMSPLPSDATNRSGKNHGAIVNTPKPQPKISQMTIGPNTGHHPSMSRETMMIADGIGIAETLTLPWTSKAAVSGLVKGFKSLSEGVETAAKNIVKLDNWKVGDVVADRMLVGEGDKVAVIGRNMTDRVQKFADGIGAETFKPSDEALEALANGDNTLLMTENTTWANKLVDEGYSVIDVGLDPKYTNQGNLDKGSYYQMETEVIFGDQ